ncbi:MAG: IS110 family transposase [Bacteroidales bacterium]|jgi:transposase|nr:IS110 family transposase [Bacteroidales bacterium]
MESTSTYWVPIWDILRENDFYLQLVNPLHIKQMPSRKSDAKDAQLITELLYKNTLRGSFIPSSLIQELLTLYPTNTAVLSIHEPKFLCRLQTR